MDHILGMNINPNAYVRVPAIIETAKDWRYYENAITHHEQVGAKLYLEYKDSGSWKAHYKTWADACVPLGKSRSQIDKLIKQERSISAECANESPSETLATVNTMPDPMADLNPPEPPKNKGNGHMTPKATAKAAPAAKEIEEKNPVDTTGHPIPQTNLKFWTRRQEVQDLISVVSDLRTKIKAIAGQNAESNGHTDPLYAGQGWQAPIENLNALYYQLTECKPDVVCPNCDGKLKDDMGRACSECRRTGFISAKNWTAKRKSEVKHILAQVARHEKECK